MALAAAALALLAWKCWANDEQAIRKLLDNLAKAASVQPTESVLARLAYGDRLASFFTTNATLNLEAMGGELGSVHGRTELAQTAMGVRSALHEAEFKVAEAVISFPAEKGAASGYVVIAGHIRGHAPLQLNREKFGQAFHMAFRKEHGRWRIENAEAEESLH